jgi:hypothetical protein
MTEILKKLKWSMPIYMCENILSYVAKSKKDAVIDEIRHYFRTHQHHNPQVKDLIHSLVTEELVSDCADSIPPEFFTATTRRSDNIDIDLRYNNRTGLCIKVIFNYFWPRETSEKKDYVAVEVTLHRKRTYQENITFMMPSHWKTTPLCGMYIFSDTSAFHNGKLLRTPNAVTGALVQILMARLPKDIEDILHQAVESNEWSNMQDVCGQILCCANTLKRHKMRCKYQFIVDMVSQDGDCIHFRQHIK